MITDTSDGASLRQDHVVYRTLVSLERLQTAYHGIRERADITELIEALDRRLARAHGTNYRTRFKPVPWHPAAGDPIWIDDDPSRSGHVLSERRNGIWAVRVPTNDQGRGKIVEMPATRIRLAGADRPRPTPTE